MVKALILGLLAATMCGLAMAAPAPHKSRPSRPEASPSTSDVPQEDSNARSERSTDLSHITGTPRKIQMFIKDQHLLQLLPDGTVNGSSDDTSVYTIFQRTTVGIGRLKIQGIATCQHLCMDSCGLLYGSREFSDECVFNEMIEQHHYNTYSSTKYSNERRSLYLALNGRGRPRKVLLKANQQLGRWSSFTRVLTRTVTPERAEELHPMRHHGHQCASYSSESPARLSRMMSETSTEPLRCRKRKKKKKKKRKCPEDESDSELCHKRQTVTSPHKVQSRLNKKCDSEDSEECQRKTMKKKQETNNKGDKNAAGGAKKKKKAKTKRPKVISVTEAPITAPSVTTEEATLDEDYTVDTTTNWEWDESTAIPTDLGTSPRPD